MRLAARTHYPPRNRARGRARTRASRASLSSGWCREAPVANSRWDPPPPKHKISLRRARDEPPRARARVVAQGLGPSLTVVPPSFCTCAREKTTSGRARAEARARFSEFDETGPYAWCVRERCAPRPVWSWCKEPSRRARSSHLASADIACRVMVLDTGVAPTGAVCVSRAGHEALSTMRSPAATSVHLRAHHSGPEPRSLKLAAFPRLKPLTSRFCTCSPPQSVVLMLYAGVSVPD